MKKSTFDLLRDLLTGATIQTARIILKEYGYRYREVRNDGVSTIITCDYDPYRVNLTVKDGVVSEVEFG